MTSRVQKGRRKVSSFNVSLLGRFGVCRDGQSVAGFETRRVQELFAYLLLHRGRSQSREVLAGSLWTDSGDEQSRKSLRQALWQLQTALESKPEPESGTLLKVDPEWIALNPAVDLWLDVAVLEKAFERVRGVRGRDLDASRITALQEAVDLYRGDLLEGCYLDWCLWERDRLQQLYLSLLDKLMDWCQAQRRYETGLYYGVQILRVDRCSERTHRRMMRLQYLAGDRTAALQQYRRCAAALREELGAKPERRTEELYFQIRDDQMNELPSPGSVGEPPDPNEAGTRSDPEGTLNQFLGGLLDLQRQIQQQMLELGQFLARVR
jgi:DNA-binding SARP family transcriptional activator